MMKNLAPLLFVLAVSCGPGGPPPVPSAALPVYAAPSGGELVLVPAGEFRMGSAAGRPDEGPVHKVSVGAFYIDRHAVTQELFEKVTGVNPSKNRAPRNPVERIQWTAAVRFLNKCSEKDGLSPCYDLKTWECDFEADGYRLPTEAEWEYACRAGSAAAYSFGGDAGQFSRHGWGKPNSGGAPHPVGQKAPNAWGLYDMHGNVWEWCNDFYGEYKESPGGNPRGPASGTQRVLRGGAADAPVDRCTASARSKELPVFGEACFGADFYGFRRVRSAAGRKKAVASASVEEPAPAPVAAPAPAVPTGKIAPARLKGTIVFVSDRGGARDLWRMHATGRDAKRLTNDAHADADPRWSPDGRAILYTSRRGGNLEVWRMDRDGSGAAKVTAGSQGAWSPDGKSILLIRDNQAWVRELGSGAERRVTPEAWERCGFPAWDPAGPRFAVASRHEEQVGIYLLGLDGSSNRRLKTPEPACTPCFSKDGKKLLFQTTKGKIHQMGTDGRGEEPVTFGADIQHDGRYSPDGTLLLFARAHSTDGPWQICVTDLDSEDLASVPLTREDSNSQPDWHESEE